MSISSISRGLEKVETKILDTLGYIPVVSTFSGIFRTKMGLVEVIVGIATSIFGALANNQIINEFGNKLFVNGCANILRGSIEMIPIVNLLTLIYDIDDHGHFTKPDRFSYIH